jgi:hypothetical protein
MNQKITITIDALDDTFRARIIHYISSQEINRKAYEEMVIKLDKLKDNKLYALFLEKTKDALWFKLNQAVDRLFYDSGGKFDVKIKPSKE